MQKWYNSINANQKIFLLCISVLLILVFGLGLIPLAVLVYLELGTKGPLFGLKYVRKQPEMGDDDYLEWANREGRFAERETQ